MTPPEPLILEPTNWCVFNNAGRVDSGEEARQGPVINGEKGDYYTTIWTFPSLVIPTGFELDKLQVFLYPKHWYYYTGGKCKLTVHAQLDIPTTRPKVFEILTIEAWPICVAKWVTLPKEWHEMFLKGTASGIGIGTKTTSLKEYGRFDPNIKLRATLKASNKVATVSIPPEPIGESVTVPIALLKQLLQSVGGSFSLDAYDLMTPNNGHIQVEKQLDPFFYRFRWVDE